MRLLTLTNGPGLQPRPTPIINGRAQGGRRREAASVERVAWCGTGIVTGCRACARASTCPRQRLPAPEAAIVGALRYKNSDRMENYGIHHGRASRTWENSKHSTMGKDKTNPYKPYYMFESMGLDEGELNQTSIPWN